MSPLNRHLLTAAVVGALAILSGTALAQQQESPAVKSEPIYGYQMMTPQERDEYRARMRNARSAEERQAVRAEHHAAMVERAKERGMTLPETPPAAGGRMGPGGGMGPGMGPRDGMGRGGGMGPGGSRP